MIRVIKRYESRKLYDPEESRYVGLEDVAGWVREGQEVRVVDNATSEEVTAQVLTQIILEEGKRGTSRVSTELLHQLVREGRRAVSSGVEQVQGKLGHLVTASVDRLPPVRRVREEMSHLRDRLAELEKMLEALETAETPAPPAIADREAAADRPPAPADGSQPTDQEPPFDERRLDAGRKPAPGQRLGPREMDEKPPFDERRLDAGRKPAPGQRLGPREMDEKPQGQEPQAESKE